MIRSVIAEENTGSRLDSFVVSRLPLLSRASVQKLINNEQVLVNKKPAKMGYKLRLDDVVVVKYDQLEREQIPDIALPILYEDEDCLVIDKPVGVLSHSKGAFNPEATVATFLQQMVPKLKTQVDAGREGIVHRLDRATSGVMITAKTTEAHQWLQKQFAERKVQKMYVAIVAGQPEPEAAIIDMPIERNPKKPQTFRAGSNGKLAQTAYKVMHVTGRQPSAFSLVELKPHTGRTHQLRVHLKQIGYPIIGDTLYGGQRAERLYLHALSLEITLPDHSRQTFTAPLPEAFNSFMSASQ